MYDAEIRTAETLENFKHPNVSSNKVAKPSRVYSWEKRAVDLAAVFLLAPVALLAAVGLLVLNPFFNRGSLLYRQTRMGKDGRPFSAYKFRSMVEANPVRRGAFDGLEVNRITKLGSLMRKLRIDELPQLLNVLKGEMSLVGPRPDFIDHANVYVKEIPGYRERYSVRPGVTGLAQIEVGYVSDHSGFRRKVSADLEYIQKMSFTYDLKLIMRTVIIVLARRGR